MTSDLLSEEDELSLHPKVAHRTVCLENPEQMRKFLLSISLESMFKNYEICASKRILVIKVKGY